MAYIGKQGISSTTLTSKTLTTMVGNGSTTTLTLSSTPASVNDVAIYLDGIFQRPTNEYTLSGSTITFTTAPANNVFVCALVGGGEHIGSPMADSISTEKLADGTITNADIDSVSTGKVSGTLPALNANAVTGLNAANLVGSAMPAIDGSNLTGLSSFTKNANDPATNTNGTQGDVWANTTSGELFVLTDATTDANVWTNVGEGTGDVQPITYSTATGGTITTNGNFKIHTFVSSGTFQVTTLGDSPLFNILTIAGGGAGSGAEGGGGAGAGGFKFFKDRTLAATSYTTTIGGGGASADGNIGGASGSNSSFASLVATGGGGTGALNSSGLTGGSGGGGSGRNSTSGASGTTNQGNSGGNATSSSGSTDDAGGGGGGSKTAGGNGSSTTPGNGGAGYQEGTDSPYDWEANDGSTASFEINGTGNSYAGGGAGGSEVGSSGTGGSGGGGNSETAGTANTGGGGGGNHGSRTPSGAGGSGVVIIRYKFQ